MFGSHKAGDVASNFKRTERVAMMLEHGEGGPPPGITNQPTRLVAARVFHRIFYVQEFILRANHFQPTAPSWKNQEQSVFPPTIVLPNKISFPLTGRVLEYIFGANLTVEERMLGTLDLSSLFLLSLKKCALSHQVHTISTGCYPALFSL